MLILVIFARSLLQPRPNQLGEKSKVVIKDEQTGRTITFNGDGLVVYEDESGVLYETWEVGKMASFFEYLLSLGLEEGIPIYDEEGNIIGYVSPDDELIDTIADDIGGGGDDDEDDISQYFATPTPNPGGGGSGGSGGGGGSGGSGGGGGGAPSWCSYWKLSFCAAVKKETPTPIPNNQGVIEAQDCEDWSTKTDQKKTVISNEACFRYTPTPAP